MQYPISMVPDGKLGFSLLVCEGTDCLQIHTSQSLMDRMSPEQREQTFAALGRVLVEWGKNKPVPSPDGSGAEAGPSSGPGATRGR